MKKWNLYWIFFVRNVYIISIFYTDSPNGMPGNHGGAGPVDPTSGGAAAGMGLTSHQFPSSAGVGHEGPQGHQMGHSLPGPSGVAAVDGNVTGDGGSGGGNPSTLLWSRTQRLSDEYVRQLHQIYGEHFPIEARHHLADWLEASFGNESLELEPGNPDHDEHARILAIFNGAASPGQSQRRAGLFGQKQARTDRW